MCGTGRLVASLAALIRASGVSFRCGDAEAKRRTGDCQKTQPSPPFSACVAEFIRSFSQIRSPSTPAT